MSSIRSPIVSVLGHVDHGKSSVLDAIRDSNILATEAGAITQAIGASIIPKETLICKCGDLLQKMGVKLTIPGLLFIDTPGHAAFTSLRKRGGSLADIAIVVVDIMEGCKPQTLEAIEILRASKTPFIIAANKLDTIPRINLCKDTQTPILKTISNQEEKVVQFIENKIYELIGQLHESFGMQSERFDRVEDFTKQVAIIPISAKQQRGMSELLMVIGALAQKFLEQRLEVDESGPAKGTILEVKEEKGLGTSLDVILYNGTLHTNDTVVIGGLNKPIVTHVRALFEPAAHQEMRDNKSSFAPVKKVTAATGVKITCPDCETVLSGMPLLSCEKNEQSIAQAKEQVQKQIEDMSIQTDTQGIIIKADNIGSLEALSTLLREQGFTIRKASVGPISKKDIADATSNIETNELHAAILGFNIPQVESTESVKIFTSPVIYHLIDAYNDWTKEKEEEIKRRALVGVIRPAKVQILPNCIFRQKNPCVCGVEILQGTLVVGVPLIKSSGDKLNIVKEIQASKENVKSAAKGKQVAISIPGITGGRHVNEEDIMLVDISPPDFRKLKEHQKYLDEEEKELLKELAQIKRKEDPLWGK
ncbi:MAG: translation initiation factor IF-2 [Candidatus Woesearchaeota archaeon]